MRRIGQQPVPLLQRFPHQLEFAIFQIAQPAMHHPRQCSARPRAIIVALDQQHVDALQRQLPEHADAVDAAADHQYLGLRTSCEPVENLFAIHSGASSSIHDGKPGGYGRIDGGKFIG